MNYRHGMAFPDADVFMAAQLGVDGRYQADHLAAALSCVTEWSCAIDLGAHVGVWTRELSIRFARVIAVEPSPDTFEALRLNCADLSNVQLEPVAVGAASGQVSMAIDEKNAARRNTGARYVQPGGDIPLVTVDSWLLPAVGFIKADIEGSELPALRGAHDTLMRCRPVVLFEEKGFGVRFGVQRGETEAYLSELGYRKRAQISADQVWGPA